VAVNMSDIFDGGSFTGVVNSPDLGAVAKQEHIVPYVLLAEKIGSIQGQLLKGNKINSITVNLRGKDIADAKITDVIRSAVIKGVREIIFLFVSSIGLLIFACSGALGEIVAQPISYVNAISVADEIGLRVLVNMSEKVT
jgi:hypothetical protein